MSGSSHKAQHSFANIKGLQEGEKALQEGSCGRYKKNKKNLVFPQVDGIGRLTKGATSSSRGVIEKRTGGRLRRAGKKCQVWNQRVFWRTAARRGERGPGTLGLLLRVEDGPKNAPENKKKKKKGRRFWGARNSSSGQKKKTLLIGGGGGGYVFLLLRKIETHWFLLKKKKNRGKKNAKDASLRAGRLGGGGNFENKGKNGSFTSGKSPDTKM